MSPRPVLVRAALLQYRLDALRRKCTTGYGCGSSCISLRKECRTSPGSSIGKQRLKRLLALAAGGKVAQRGIAPVRAQEAGELAAGIGQKRNIQAASLRGERQQNAATKGGERLQPLTTQQMDAIRPQLSTGMEVGIPGYKVSGNELSAIYAVRGYDARPELVSEAENLQSRLDLIQNAEGTKIFYRGVDQLEYADQFKGLGPNGGSHYPGIGLYGNGSYAATENGEPDSDYNAKRTAKDYAGQSPGKNKRVIVFGIKASAKVFDATVGKHPLTNLMQGASDLMGVSVRDGGAAAAILGYQAIRAKNFRDDCEYWVILDRSIVVAAKDSGLRGKY